MTHSIIPESEYSKKISKEHRKKFAQFFTPTPIADLMARWLCGNKEMKTVLEPAFGLGVFSRSLLRINDNISIDGFDIDDIIISEAKKYFDDVKNVSIRNQDYIFSPWEKKYDGIICNPPYFKFQDYDNLTVTNEVNRKLNLECSGFTNLYAYFLIKSVHQLSSGGRCAYIIPSEFMNSDYGVQVKEFLLKSKSLRHVIVFDFEEQVFDEAITTSSILLFSMDEHDDDVSFFNVKNSKDLNDVLEIINEYPYESGDILRYPSKELRSSIKWKSYYQPLNQNSYTDLVPFSTFAKVSRGIATGANNFFKFNVQKASVYNIPENNLKPCICHCTDIDGAFFDQPSFNALRDSGKFVYIFDGVNSSDPNVEAYIKKGEEEKCNEKFLTKNRSPWYALEKREPAPIWVSVFSRNRLHFVRNTSNATCLTTFHCIYLNNTLFDAIPIDLLFAYLLTDTARLIFLDNGREYGNGLSKFEPNDLNKGMMLDLRLLSDEEKEQIILEYRAFELGDGSAISRIDHILRSRFSK